MHHYPTVQKYLPEILNLFNSDEGNFHGVQACIRAAIFLTKTVQFFQKCSHIVPHGFRKELLASTKAELEYFQIVVLLRFSGRRKADGSFADEAPGKFFTIKSAVYAKAFLMKSCNVPVSIADKLSLAITECKLPDIRITTLLGWLLKFVVTAESLRDHRAKVMYMHYFPGWEGAFDDDKLLIEQWVLSHYAAIRAMNRFACVSLVKMDDNYAQYCLYQADGHVNSAEAYQKLKLRFSSKDFFACYRKIDDFVTDYYIKFLKKLAIDKEGFDFFNDKMAKKLDRKFLREHSFFLFLSIKMEPLYRAYRIQQYLLQEGVASFFTGQRSEAILFQIIIKKIYAHMGNDFGSNYKVTRVDEAVLTDIYDEAAGEARERQDVYLAASSSIFDSRFGESCFSFLCGCRSSWTIKLFQHGGDVSSYLFEKIISYVNRKLRGDIGMFLSLLRVQWEELLSKLPKVILELMIVNNRPDFAKTIFICEKYASNPRQPKSYQELLVGTRFEEADRHYQVRILAPNNVSTNRVRMLRFVSDECKPMLNAFKQQVEQLITAYLSPYFDLD
jgi:hypothetical protein